MMIDQMPHNEALWTFGPSSVPMTLQAACMIRLQPLFVCNKFRQSLLTMPCRPGISPWSRWWLPALILVLLARIVSHPAMAKPNILLIYLDDFGWKDASFMGSDFFETPHLDRMSKEGMTFTSAYSCAANCAPARACLLSGQYTPRHKIYNVGTKPRGKAEYRRLEHIPGVDTLDTQIRTWAHQLQAAGYRTATIGKWHLSQDPLPYGFDLNVGGNHRGSPPRGYYPPHADAPGLGDAPANEYLTDRLCQETIQFIRDNKDHPWMVYLTHFAVHTPHQAKRELVDKYRAKQPGRLHQDVNLATMIQAVDDSAGRIQAVLDELNLTENTVVIFTSDNGGYGESTDMAPLKGYKGCYYEGGIREPMFVRWPGVVTPGSTCHQPTIAVDLYPTICEIAGADLPDGQLLDGVSLVPTLKGDDSGLQDRPVYWHFPAYLQSYRRVVSEQRDPLFRSRPCSLVRKGDWKLHQYFEDGGIELYDLRTDIGETRNLAGENVEKREELLGLLKKWQQETGADIPSRKNPKFRAEAERKAIQKRLAQDQ